jgi:hypothetical protein
MTTRTYGILASVIGSALGAWLWNRQRHSRNAHLTPPRERGTVIYDNTPTVPDEASEGII